MPQGKCAFCGTFVTGGGTAMGKHSVACTSCTPLALKWLEKHGEAAVGAGAGAEAGQSPPASENSG
jgi:hypothetical protein